MTPAVDNMMDLLEIVGLYGDHKPAPREYVQKTFHEKPIRYARLPNYEDNERLCKTLNLIAVGGERISLTSLGEEALGHYGGERVEFQKFFIKNVLLGSDANKEIHDAFFKFSVGKSHNLVYPKKEIHSLFKVQDMLPILYEIDLLRKKDNIVEINPRYAKLTTDNGWKIAQEQFEAQLANEKTIGEIAEEIALANERERCVNAGNVEESMEIDQVSRRFVNAGYDIESFSKDENGKIHRIYIEVKGSSGVELDFHISANELKKAKEYGKRYWIYFVPGIDIETRRSSQEAVIMINPSETVFNNSEYTVKTEKYHVTKMDS